MLTLVAGCRRQSAGGARTSPPASLTAPPKVYFDKRKSIL